DGILKTAERYCHGRMDHRRTDPAGNHQTAVGLVTLREFESAGLTDLKPWPKVAVNDALLLIDSLTLAADGKVYLHVHPRCTGLIRALQAYRRDERQGVILDRPKDPQHPLENYVDALKNAVVSAIGLRGRLPDKERKLVHARNVFLLENTSYATFG